MPFPKGGCYRGVPLYLIWRVGMEGETVSSCVCTSTFFRSNPSW